MDGLAWALLECGYVSRFMSNIYGWCKVQRPAWTLAACPVCLFLKNVKWLKGLMKEVKYTYNNSYLRETRERKQNGGPSRRHGGRGINAKEPVHKGKRRGGLNPRRD